MKPIVVFRQVEHEGTGTLRSIFGDAGFDCRCVDMFSSGPVSFEPREASGLVVLGGPMNVDQIELYPHLVQQRLSIRAALDAELPVLGICLGAQLLARTLGAEVRPRPMKEIGWYSIDTSAAAAGDALFCHFGPCPTVFQWHGDGFGLPAGAVHLAGSPLCPEQAFRYRRTAYGLQFHLEVTAEMIDRWLREAGNCAELSELPYVDATEIRRRTANELPTMHDLGQKVFGAFADMCKSEAGIRNSERF